MYRSELESANKKTRDLDAEITSLMEQITSLTTARYYMYTITDDTRSRSNAGEYFTVGACRDSDALIVLVSRQ